MESPNSDFLMNFGGYDSPTGYRMTRMEKLGKRVDCFESKLLIHQGATESADENSDFRKSGTFQRKALNSKGTVKNAENRKLEMIKSISKISFFQNLDNFQIFGQMHPRKHLGASSWSF